jgi:hypothetical protein
VVKISDVGSLYFQRYSLWKLGFLNAPEISFKQVILRAWGHFDSWVLFAGAGPLVWGIFWRVIIILHLFADWDVLEP